jgi:FixJ family two-component response regulator
VDDESRPTVDGLREPPQPVEGTERHAGARRGHRDAREGRPAVAKPPLVSVVDDDESMRESLPDLLRELGFAAEAFAAAEEFLASKHLGRTQCLVLDVAMPGMSGPELQEELAQRGRAIPIVFISAQQDESIRARVLAAGAVAYLYKPFSDTALLDVLKAALAVSS